MPRGTDTVSSMTVDLDRTERDFCDHMKQAAGLASDQNLLRAALFHFARHLDVPVSVQTFAIRKPGGMQGRSLTPTVCETCGHHRKTRLKADVDDEIQAGRQAPEGEQLPLEDVPA